MKKIIGIFVIIIAVAMSFVSCDPVEIRNDMGGAITVDQLDVKATPVLVNGVRSNKIIVENRSPILSNWNYGMGISRKAYDQVLVTSVGDMIITFTGLNADGTTISKDLPINVEKILFKTSDMNLFIGDGTKTWVWDQFTNEQTFGGVTAIYPYGIGDASKGDKMPTLGGLADGTFDQSDATLTFSFDNAGGAIITKTLGNGTKQTGTFSYNLTKKIGDWSKGIISLKGATIPHPVSMNGGGGDAQEFFILQLDEDNLVLATNKGNTIANPTGEVNIWMFRPKGWVAAPNDEQMAFITGGSEKIWGWDPKADLVWGNGGYLASYAPSWWGVNLAGMEGQTPGEGANATMTFSMAGVLTKNKSDGTKVSGTYTIDMTKPTYTDDAKTTLWGMGRLKTKDVTVLSGKNPNSDPKNEPVYLYDILKLNDTDMVLAAPEDPKGGAWSGCWFYMFKAK